MLKESKSEFGMLENFARTTCAGSVYGQQAETCNR